MVSSAFKPQCEEKSLIDEAEDDVMTLRRVHAAAILSASNHNFCSKPRFAQFPLPLF